MGARPKPEKGCTTGNFISEWFGYRVWNSVDDTEKALHDQSGRICPFLTAAIGDTTSCVKVSNKDKTGVCTISSDANGTREDWLACPYRTLDEEFRLLTEAVRVLFKIPEDTAIKLYSGEKLKRPEYRVELANDVENPHVMTFVFLAQKLGGEVDLPETPGSPGAKVDVSVIHILACDETGTPVKFGRHFFYEIQTSDFHGSPLHAFGALADLCPVGSGCADFHERLRNDIEICGTGVEGPNKANVFKRTFYQIALKIAVSNTDDCAGFVIVIPKSVWASWRIHLGNPELAKGTGVKRALLANGENAEKAFENARSWIFVFDIDVTAATTPHPLVIEQQITVSQTSLLQHAFERAVEQTKKYEVVSKYRTAVVSRIQANWKASKSRKAR